MCRSSAWLQVPGGLRRWWPRRPRRPRDGEDGDGGSGHPVLRRGGPRLPGGLDWRRGWVIGVGVAKERGIGSRPSGGEELVTGDSRLAGR